MISLYHLEHSLSSLFIKLNFKRVINKYYINKKSCSITILCKYMINYIMQVFTNWVNLYLGKRDLQVKDLKTDLSDGVLLCNLMEIISGKKLPTRYAPFFILLHSPIPHSSNKVQRRIRRCATSLFILALPSFLYYHLSYISCIFLLLVTPPLPSPTLPSHFSFPFSLIFLPLHWVFFFYKNQ